jgi:hypothetical protein
MSPRRFLLVDREQPIACERNGPARWALDHLFLDQDGLPTFVEVKGLTIRGCGGKCSARYSTTPLTPLSTRLSRHRRNGSQRACAKMGKTVMDVLAGHIGVDGDADAFWSKVKANLQANRIRVLFVADKIPPEPRKVVDERRIFQDTHSAEVSLCTKSSKTSSQRT